MTAPPDGTGRRIAMWSGPRNISTAMMRSFGNRADTTVIDEPFYAVYLDRTGSDHPGRDAVLASMPTDWRRVVGHLLGPIPNDRPVWYQKHMTHHMVPGIPLDWMQGISHAFLIRRPAAMLASYLRRRGTVSMDDLGLVQQHRLFRHVTGLIGSPPPVVDADDVLADPAGLLSALCRALDLAFDPSMLSWPAGRRPTDGVWADHWYAAVEGSTGFEQRPEPKEPDVPAHWRGLLADCEAIYGELSAYALKPDPAARTSDA